jgi:hypothetical protein
MRTKIRVFQLAQRFGCPDIDPDLMFNTLILPQGFDATIQLLNTEIKDLVFARSGLVVNSTYNGTDEEAPYNIFVANPKLDAIHSFILIRMSI